MDNGIPHHIIMKLARLNIKRPASWRVLLAIIGETGSGDVAHLQIVDICKFTGLCERTVKSAVGELIMTGIIVRVGRVGAFSIPILKDVGEPVNRSPTTGFSAKQVATVRKALREAGLLLGQDPTTILMPASGCEQLGLVPGLTFHAAFLSISTSHDRDIARRFVGLVLEFRHSEAVGGSPAHCSIKHA